MQSPDPPQAEGIDDTDGIDDRADTAYDDTAYDDTADDDTADDRVPERDVPSAPTTGDAVVDAAMVELASAEAGTLSERIDAGERAHRVLQGRLSDLGGA
jgi:hypothetical protein